MGRKTNADLNQVVSAIAALLTPVQTIATQSAIKTVTVSGSVNTAAEGAIPLPPTLTLTNNTLDFFGSITYPTLSFTSSAFAYIGSVQTLSQIQMQISTDSGFGNVVATLSVGTALTFTLAASDYAPPSKSWFATPGDLLSAQVLWFRIRHFNTSGYASSWSAAAVLTVGNYSSITSARFTASAAGQRIILGNAAAGSSGSSTTWADYTGVAVVCAIGGGGAASVDSFTSGAGGGGSGYVGVGVVNVTPSMAFTYVTGARGYDAGDAGATGGGSSFNASSYTPPGSSSITIAGVTITGAGGGQAFLRTSPAPVGGSGGSGGGGYGNYATGGNNGANGAGGSGPGIGSGNALCSGGAGTGGESDDGGKYSAGAGGAGFCLDFSGVQGTAQGGSGRTSGRGGGIGCGGGGRGRDQTWNASQMRAFSGGVVLLKKYW